MVSNDKITSLTFIKRASSGRIRPYIDDCQWPVPSGIAVNTNRCGKIVAGTSFFKYYTHTYKNANMLSENIHLGFEPHSLCK